MGLRGFELLAPSALLILLVVLPLAAWYCWRSYDPMRGSRKLLVFGVRLLVLALIALALAEARAWRERPEEKICILALLDVSSSVPQAQLDEALPQLEKLFAAADEQHAIGLIVFAGQAQLVLKPDVRVPSADALRTALARARAHKETSLDAAHTNVAAAIDLAQSVFAAGFARRIVLFSDGNATDGDARQRIAQCREAGVDVHTVTLAHDKGAFDLALAGLNLPTALRPGVGFDVTVRIAAREEGPATLLLYRNGYRLEEVSITLQRGMNQKVFRQQLDKPGLYLYLARVRCERKQQSIENDVAYGFARLRSVPKVLLIGEKEFEAQHVLAALRKGGAECEYRSPDGIPERLIELLDFDMVVLNNLSAAAFPLERQRLVRDYVELFGGGLLSIGLDPNGGYAGTPLEEALPVTCDPKRLQKLSLSVVLIADTSRSVILADLDEAQKKSGAPDSPKDAVEELDRPAIIRQTAQQVLQGMGESDYFGLINFGTEMFAPAWIVRPQKVYDRQLLARCVEEGLQTAPAIRDPEALAAWLKRELDPAVELPPDKIAAGVLKTLNVHSRPHCNASKLMDFARDVLKARNKQLNSLTLAEGVERFIRPNAFLARSNVFRSIARAAQELQQRETARKRIILLSDGYFEGHYDYTGIAGQLAAEGINFSTIALKQTDAHLVMLEALSRWGVGQHYRLEPQDKLDSLLKREFEALGHPRSLEVPFRARQVTDSRMLRGLDLSLAPPLFGYVRSAPKLGTETILGVPPDYEPLLATWRYSAGRTAVFTSDSFERWGILWVRNWSQGFNRLWCGVVENLRGGPRDKRIVPQLNLRGEEISLAAEVTTQDGSFVNAEPLRAQFYFLGEEGYLFSRTSVEEIALPQSEPGRYQGRYRVPAKGLYLVRLVGRSPDDVVVTAAVVSSSAEDCALSADSDELKCWADAGGGKLDAAPEVWLNLSGKTRLELLDISRVAAILAAVLFALDVLLRRWPAITLFVRERSTREGRR